MAEYIEREKVKDELLTWAVLIRNPRLMLREDALCVIDSIPAADVVEVVRCRYCKHSNWWQETCHGRIRYYCKKLCRQTYKDGFCSYGERRDSDG